MAGKNSTTGRSWAFDDQTRKRTLNGAWVDALALIHAMLAILPSPVRNLAWRALLRTCGTRVFFDRKVYVKFPWLVSIGSRVSVNRGCEFYPDLASRSEITIGDDVYLAPHVRFHASGHDVDDLETHVGAPISVGDGSWLGAGAILLPGVRIGRRCVVGAGSVVTKDVPDDSIAVGSPAQVIRTRSDAGDPPRFGLESEVDE
jgi:maltose O-acetyltransferase